MKLRIILGIVVSLAAVSSPAQTNLLTFTNNSGVIYSNARVVKVETDGVLFALTNWQYSRVKFTNMPAPLQTWFGYDPEAIRKANEERLAEEKAAQERQIAEAKPQGNPVDLFLWQNRKSELEQEQKEHNQTNFLTWDIFIDWSIRLKSALVTLEDDKRTSFNNEKREHSETIGVMT